jgi:hypothetical protein
MRMILSIPAGLGDLLAEVCPEADCVGAGAGIAEFIFADMNAAEAVRQKLLQAVSDAIFILEDPSEDQDE